MLPVITCTGESKSSFFDLLRARNYETTRVQSPIYRRASMNGEYLLHECGFNVNRLAFALVKTANVCGMPSDLVT